MSSIIDLLNEVDHSVYIGDKYRYHRQYWVPRVTDILSTMIHSDALMYWANRLGFKKISYKNALNDAAQIGTEAHNRIERFLKEKFVSDDNNYPFLSFMEWYNEVSNFNYIECMASEVTEICEYFGGTYDAIFGINGKYYLTDFKTSNYVTYKYFLQLAAYRFMLKRRKMHMSGVIVLQLNKDSIGFNEYVLNFDIPEHYKFIEDCEKAFLSLVYAFYQLKGIEISYENLFGKG